MAERSYRGLLLGLALVGAVLDQGTKYQVFRWLYHDGDGSTYEVVPGAFRLLTQFTGQHADPGSIFFPLQTWGGAVLPRVNHGALFGLGGGYEALANGVFALVSVLAAAAILYWSTRSCTARDGALCAALGLILAGALGNLYDRVVFGGVRDFLHFYWIDWPVFNVADCCLVCGAGLLLVQAFWSGRPEEIPAPAATEEAPAAEMVSAK